MVYFGDILAAVTFRSLLDLSFNSFNLKDGSVGINKSCAFLLLLCCDLHKGKERSRSIINLLSSPRETRAGVREPEAMPSPETMAMVERMACKLLSEDEVAAVMRHCSRVSMGLCIHASSMCAKQAVLNRLCTADRFHVRQLDQGITCKKTQSNYSMYNVIYCAL